MRYILTFKTDFPESSEFDYPKGYSVAKFLQNELARKGIKVHTMDNYDDFAWSVDCQINDKNIFFFVSYLGSKQSEWQLIVCSIIGFFGRFFGWKNENERSILANAIHDILTKDNRFSDLKWFSRYTDRPSDQWYPSPDPLES